VPGTTCSVGLGTHEPFFELAEDLSWMEELPTMEAHVRDGGHMLLETQAAEADAAHGRLHPAYRTASLIRESR
jgi:hypothetical protein